MQMDRLLTTATSRALDRYTVKKGQATEEQLMKRAGRAVAIETAKAIGGDTEVGITIVCGKGHNGGDGLAAAGFLASWGYAVQVALVGKIDSMDSVVAGFHKDATFSIAEQALPDDIPWMEGSMIIDALLGIGVDGPLRDSVAQWVQAINGQHGVVLSVDLPSGLGADTGEIWNGAVKADITVTMGAPKLGLLINEGPEVAGKIIVADIGFSPDFMQDLPEDYFRFGPSDFRALFSPPARRTYKHRQGKTLVIAGSRGMTGAAALASAATISSGSGITIAACPLSLQSIYAAMQREIITLGLDDHGQGLFLPEHVSLIQETLGWCTGVVLGPGLSRAPQSMKFVRELFQHLDSPTVLDADGLSPFNGEAGLLDAAQHPLVLTPHAQEFAKLFDHDLQEVMNNPVRALEEVKSYFKKTVVLKGAPTMLLLSTGAIVVNSTGNPGMATAGSGDVLSGIIGTFLSQDYSADDAAMMGVWLHGLAGDMAEAKVGAPGMTASHILAELPAAVPRIGATT